MATGTSVSNLFINLGLNLSDLETGFVTASQTVAANISRLNRESNLVRIRSEIDIAGLDETADAERILQIRTNALNEQMRIQRDRIRILDAEYQNLVQSQGANSTAAQRAIVRLERERLALANLDRELRNLNDSSNSSNNGMFDSFGEMLPKLQGAEIALDALNSTFEMIKESVTEVVENFRELQKQSYELDMPFEETRDFLREMKLAGGDIGDIEGYIRGISDAWVKGEFDDPEFIALRKYGAEIVDATGRLKNFKALTEEVYRAWKKADTAGEGIEFLQLTGGEMGVRDIIQYFQRLEEARKDAAKIYEAKIDDKQLHELDRVFGRVEEQSIELKNAIGDIFTPAAQAAGEKFFQMLHDGTEFIVENKDEIQTWGRIAIGVFEELAPKINQLTLSGKISTLIEDAKTIYDELTKNQESFKPSDEMKKYLDAQSAANPISALMNAFSESDIVKRAIEEQKIYNGELEETNAVANKVEKGLKTLSEAQNEYNDVLSQYGSQRVKQFKDELADLQLEIDFKDDDYVKAIAELDLWRKRELEDKNFVTQGERDAINELYEARKKLIDLERDDNLADIRESVDAEFKSSIDARIDKINEEKEAWVSAGMDAAEAMELSQKRIDKAMSDAAKEFEREVDSIAGKVQSLEDKVFEQEHSQYQNDLRKAQQERIKYYQEGIYDPNLIERWYSNEIDSLNKRAAKDKNYRKSPEGTTERGGNGIMVISGDKITDDGLIQSRQKEIGLLADENQILAQLLQKQRQELSGDTWAMLAQKVQSIQQPQITLPPQQQQQTGIQIIEGDKVVSMPQMSTEPLQEFGYNLQQLNAQMQQIPQIEKPAEQSTPIESLQTLKTSTEGLTAAQNTLAEKFRTMPQMPRFENSADIQSLIENALPIKSFQILKNSTGELTNAQNILADKLRSLSEMQFAAPAISQQYNLAPDKSFDLPLLVNLFPTESLQALQTSTTELTAAQDILANKIRSISEMQIASLAITQSDITPDMPLNNLDVPLSTILHEMQAKRETTISTETIVMPLNNIASIAQNILSAMGNANQPDITVSPNIRIDLGGAYVFDNGMKKTLTDDITKEVVGAITTAVNQATRQSSYSYGA